jgi:hypothetical protein
MSGQNNSDSPYLRGKTNVFLGFRGLLEIIILNLVTSPNLCLAIMYKCREHRQAAAAARPMPGPPWDRRRGIFFLGAGHTYPHLDEIHEYKQVQASMYLVCTLIAW